ncbi:MAG: C40 family peptidase [Treponema sp.]|nr:C40 family peptidase [Treponema sp.]
MTLFFLAMVFCAAGLYPAPLESGFALAPSGSASPQEKAEAYREARSRLISAAEKYENTPYRYGGVNKNGLDCSGLVYVSFRDALGIPVPRDTGGLYSWAEKIQLEDARPGDLLFFATAGSGAVSHVGIFTGGRGFIHSASEGPVTGVIRSSLDERYWKRAFIGAGRAFPGAEGQDGGESRNTAPAGLKKQEGEESPARNKKEGGAILAGVAAAPSWNTYLAEETVIRGAAFQFRIGREVRPFGQAMIIGMELRPEWDRSLGVFRVPLTLSWGLNDKYRIFAGPALSFGSAGLAVSGGYRSYAGGTSWIGAAGITAAPFSLKIAGADFSPYGELAWQSYFSDGPGSNFSADFAAGFRCSTGLRCTWRVK